MVVIGSGPGGLESARISAIRGHKVTVLEATDKIGGQLNLAAQVPGKSEFLETIRYFKNELKNLGVEIQLGHHATLDSIYALKPDAVIFATGVKPREFHLPGIEKRKPLLMWTIFPESSNQETRLRLSEEEELVVTWLINLRKMILLLSILTFIVTT
ncbi:pyridine nucleotide-disulfide oxidoreductase [Leptospira interrogans serovar Bataviae str. HAI135]|nr:pyridine nucleotide-disulfide oxidoreductase [Leptospira interrogans serovar Bataviae str. HAI135]